MIGFDHNFQREHKNFFLFANNHTFYLCTKTLVLAFFFWYSTGPKPKERLQRN
jgi:hypothetical protein